MTQFKLPVTLLSQCPVAVFLLFLLLCLHNPGEGDQLFLVVQSSKKFNDAQEEKAV